ncbi:MAG TPA: OmpA family protein [Stellaceae bacterium]|nr:OmpA family protein [Stellaceae bacterium]
MPSTARTTHRATRQLVTAAVGVFALSVGSAAIAPAHAQSPYTYSDSGSSVTVDYGVLDRLGPAPRVPDNRFVVHVPAQPGAQHVALGHRTQHHARVVAQQVVHHPARSVAQARPVQRTAHIVQIGSVTIDYGALAALNQASGARVVLRRPGTATVAAAAPAVVQPETPVAPPPIRSASQQTAALSPAANRPAPLPTPFAPSPPRVATAPSVPETRSDLNELSSLLPIGGVALAATRSPTEPVAPRNAPQSDNRAIRFAPGATQLQGDASHVLDALAQKLKMASNDRIALVAYASGDADQAIEARRVSLARAVAVRAYLIQHGVASTQIDVRALGNRVTDGGSADRVDLVTAGR